MRRIFIILTMLMTLSIGVYAQKPATTKPSVKELLSVATSKDPLSVFTTLATKNGYRSKGTSVNNDGIKTTYTKNVGSGGKKEIGRAHV